MRNRLLVAVTCAISVGCGGGGLESGLFPPLSVTNTQPPAQAPLEVSGTYRLSTQIAVPPTVFLPEQGYQAVEALQGLATNPAKTLFDLADAAGVSEVGTVQDVLPDFLETQLYQWMNELILQRLVDASPVPAQISALATDIVQPFTSFELDTSLAIAPSSTTDYAAQHRLQAVIFTPVSGAPVAVPAILADVVGTDSLTVHAQGPQLALSDHAFGLPLGDYAVAGADLLAQRQLGAASLRDGLGVLVPCAQVAQELSQRCLGPLCIAHQAELATICEKGLDAVVAQVHQRLRDQNLNAVHFVSGSATLTTTGLEAGTWDSALSIGLGERPAPATFLGKRAQ